MRLDRASKSPTIAPVIIPDQGLDAIPHVLPAHFPK